MIHSPQRGQGSIPHLQGGSKTHNLGKSLKISLNPRDFPSLRPWEISWVSGNLSALGEGFPNISPVLVQHVQYSAVHSLMILGMDQGIHSSRQISIDSVKINPSLPMIRECWIRSHLIYHIYYVICVHLIVWIIKLYLSCFALNSIRLNQSVPQLLTIIAVLPLFCLLVHHQAANQSHYCTIAPNTQD